MKERTTIFAAIATLALTSCVMIAPLPSATPSGPRTIVLGGKAYTEEDVGGFTSWVCEDFVHGGSILVEVGFFDDSRFEGLGFILYDGGYSGNTTLYRRTGMNHRWDWGGPNGTDYAFVIKPDGTGLYYDFSSVPRGMSTKASEVYRCYLR